MNRVCIKISRILTAVMCILCLFLFLEQMDGQFVYAKEIPEFSVGSDEIGFYITLDGEPVENISDRAVYADHSGEETQWQQLIQVDGVPGAYKAKKGADVVSQFSEVTIYEPGETYPSSLITMKKDYFDDIPSGSIESINFCTISFYNNSVCDAYMDTYSDTKLTVMDGEIVYSIIAEAKDNVYGGWYTMNSRSYQFDGWIDKDGKQVSEITPSPNLALYAKWIGLGEESSWESQSYDETQYRGSKEIYSSEELIAAITALNDNLYTDTELPEILKLMSDITLEDQSISMYNGMISVESGVSLTLNKTSLRLVASSNGTGASMLVKSNGTVNINDSSDLNTQVDFIIEQDAVINVTADQNWASLDCSTYGSITNSGTININGKPEKNASLSTSGYNGSYSENRTTFYNTKYGSININGGQFRINCYSLNLSPKFINAGTISVCKEGNLDISGEFDSEQKSEYTGAHMINTGIISIDSMMEENSSHAVDFYENLHFDNYGSILVKGYSDYYDGSIVNLFGSWLRNYGQISIDITKGNGLSISGSSVQGIVENMETGVMSVRNKNESIGLKILEDYEGKIVNRGVIELYNDNAVNCTGLFIGCELENLGTITGSGSYTYGKDYNHPIIFTGNEPDKSLTCCFDIKVNLYYTDEYEITIYDYVTVDVNGITFENYDYSDDYIFAPAGETIQIGASAYRYQPVSAKLVAPSNLVEYLSTVNESGEITYTYCNLETIADEGSTGNQMSSDLSVSSADKEEADALHTVGQQEETGQEDQTSKQQDTTRNKSKGIVIGIVITGVIGLSAGGLYYRHKKHIG